MRINILTIFMALVVAAFTAVLFFLGSKNREIVSEQSQEIMSHVQEDVNQYLDTLLESTERIDLTIAGLYHSLAEINPQNEQMRTVMLSVVKNYPNVSFLYIGTEEGDTYTAADLSFSNQSNFISKPNTPLPKNAAYYWQAIILSSGNPTETTYYLDKNFNVLASESFLQEHFDARDRPWYIGAKKTKGLYWSPVYKFFETNNYGITVSEPLFDSSEAVFGVVGIDLSFDLLSNFFAEQTIGKRGKTFILDSKGEVIIPESEAKYFKTISPEVISAAFQSYQKTKVKSFEIKWKGVSYLCDFEPFALKNKEDWLVAVIVPSDDFFAKLRATQQSAILIVFIILGISGLGVVYLATRLSRPIVLLAKEVDKVRHLDFSKEARVASRVKEIYLMDYAISQLRSAMQSFTRYVPKEIVQALFAQNKEIKLGGEKKEVAVFFSDIEGFTSITEEQQTETLMALLAEYFDGMSKIILTAKGTIDKYIGDSVMAFWGAPTPEPKQAALCAETALLCHAFVQAFNRRCKEKNQPLFKTRFGINSGVAIVGNIGTPERMNYTLIGDMVNAASRIQQKNKVYSTSILMGEAIRKQLDDRFVIRPIDKVEVKGKKEKIALFELMAMKGGPVEISPAKETLDLAMRFTKAFDAFQADRKGEAKQLFEELHRDFPNDLPTQLYLERLQ